MTDKLLRAVARAIAGELGDNLDDAFENKTEWVEARGIGASGMRHINEPFRVDYIDAARAARRITLEWIREPSENELLAAHRATNPPVSLPDIRAIRRAMIDQLIKELDD